MTREAGRCRGWRSYVEEEEEEEDLFAK